MYLSGWLNVTHASKDRAPLVVLSKTQCRHLHECLWLLDSNRTTAKNAIGEGHDSSGMKPDQAIKLSREPNSEAEEGLFRKPFQIRLAQPQYRRI